MITTGSTGSTGKEGWGDWVAGRLSTGESHGGEGESFAPSPTCDSPVESRPLSPSLFPRVPRVPRGWIKRLNVMCFDLGARVDAQRFHAPVKMTTINAHQFRRARD